MVRRTSVHGMWSSRLMFVLAATGAAVGLGNIWKFPYITGVNGGGAFVIIYLACVLAVGLPIMMSEVLLGRRGRRNPIRTMQLLSEEEAGAKWWQVIGWSGVLAGILILSFYSVIAGWSIGYFFKSVSGSFIGISGDGAESMFQSFVGRWEFLLFWHTIFMGMTVWVVARGVEQGLERMVKYLMPALFFLLLLMVGYAFSTDSFDQGLSFLFEPDFSRVTGETVLMAMGQAFFTLSIGMGAIMAYGAYLPENASIGRTSLMVVFADTGVAILAGIAIFPVVFENGLNPGSGPGLIFQTLPIAFGQMPGGLLFGSLFFLLLVFAAWTSAIGLIEPAVAWLVERRGMTRAGGAWAVGLTVWILGLASIFSFNIGADWTLFGNNIFTNLDFLTSNIMLPLGGLLIAVFAGWVMCKNSSVEELEMGAGTLYNIWRGLTRYVAPVAVALVFLHSVGVFDRLGVMDDEPASAPQQEQSAEKPASGESGG